MKSNRFKYSIIIFIFLITKCYGNHNKALIIPTNDSIQGIILQDIQQQYIVGNFTGKGSSDTVFFHYYSNDEQIEIKQIPSIENDWDSIINWFNQTHQIKSFISFNFDTLFFESAYKLLCFINMGDVNADGIDEIALVVDWLDYSEINSCRIYSICNNKFSLLKMFNIHESAFLQNNNKDTSVIGIKGFLEKENNVWIFRDYFNDPNEDRRMKVLQLEKCNN